MKIKICGMRRSEDIGFANLFMPDYIGFILAPNFKRTVDIEDARFLCAKTDSKIKKVGVFVDQPVRNVAYSARFAGVDIIQLHGNNEDNEYIKNLREYTDKEIWNVFKVKDADEIKKASESLADKILLDAYSRTSAGGTGEKVNTDIVLKNKPDRDFILAGGLNPENILDISTKIKPYCVDISSGVETNGFKDSQKIASAVKIIKSII